jgi:hypothetical protein
MSKQALNRVMHAVGLHVGRYHPRMELVGIDPYSDVRRLLAGVRRPVVFDVGAFGGDTVEVLRDVITTLDDYSPRRGVERVDLLKTDTQVLRGAAGLIAAGRVWLVYTELIFSQMYEGVAPFDELYRFLRERDFELVAFYGFATHNGRASWCDALFVHGDAASPADEITGVE